MINELMVGEKGKKMRLKVMELKKAEEDTRLGGHSYMNLDKVINKVLKQTKYNKFDSFSYKYKILN